MSDWIGWTFHQTSQAIGILAVIGLAVGCWRWPKATRRDFLLAFLVFLLGTAAREAVVYIWGATVWTEMAVLISGLARVAQLGGILLFIRYAIRESSSVWMMWALLGLVLLIVLVV